MVDLLSCPFCGGEPDLCSSMGSSWVECLRRGCDAEGPVKEDISEAIAAWNTRSQPQSPSTSHPQGDAGDAIDWACDHIGFNDPRDFLEAWREGQLDEYPDYLKWVAFQQKCAAEAKEQSND